MGRRDFLPKKSLGENAGRIERVKKFKSMQKDKEQMFTLTRDLLSCRAPSYPMFLFEHMTLFKIKALKEGRSW